jgi:ABC-type branched-subunit amino acid transport system substrate-binding protein
MTTRRLLPVSACLLVIAISGIASDPPEKTEKQTYGGTPPQLQPYGRFTEPYERFFLDPIEYRGHGRELAEPDNVESVKIGFLGPIEATVSVATGGASHEEPLGRKMLQGARLAIEHANAGGGYRAGGTPYELVVRNDNGLWGASGNEIIHLAYKDRVWAILGTIDGANSHIAIRVAFKAELPVINTGDTDPSFVETLIPWAFRNITDDRQMSYLLADFVFTELGLERVAALRASNRYGRVSIDEFRDAATRLGHPFLAELQYRVGDTDFRPQLERIKGLEPDVVVTWGDATESAMIYRQMREMGMDQWLVGSDRMVTAEFLELAGEDIRNVAAGYPWDPTRADPKYRAFVEAFEARFKEPPETYAAHAYDGVTMLIEAIERAGLNRARIRDELAAIKSWHGVTGHKVFDNVLSNRSPAVLALVDEGRWTFRTTIGAAPASGQPVNKDMLDDPLSFTGVDTAELGAESPPEIRIGLFAPAGETDPVGRSMLRGATVAVDRENRVGGIDGVRLRLVRRWDPDPWRGGAREVVRLVFEDRVVALIGGPDGVSTHVAQQVATKALLPLISPVSSDPSLTHTRVPWIFRLPPDDATQARVLVEDGVVGRDLRRIGLVTGTDHDSRAAAAELIRNLELADRSPVCHLTIGTRAAADDVAERLAGFGLDGLVVRTPREFLSELVSALSTAGLDLPILAPWVPAFEPGPSSELLVIRPFDELTQSRELRHLEREFVRRWGEMPSAEAVYAFDAARLIIEGLRTGATGRADLLRALAHLDGFELVTGPFDLDNGNGNVGRPVLAKKPSAAPVEVAGVIGLVESSPTISRAVSARR